MAKAIERLVMVLVELFKTTVPKPLAIEPEESAPTVVRPEALVTPEPSFVDSKTRTLLM